ncbi:MAG: response regulator transcription factor [Melioribacteraceae bacterium]|nr:response regulator transcription factor [Melioribacteraceae bacterium]
MRILLVEDEIDLLESIKAYLKSEDFICDMASNFNEALDKVGVYEYDCVIIDIMLPDGNGIDLIDEIKKTNVNCGIIIASAKNSLDDKLKGLKIGADDYLAKPFHISELSARIQAVIRRRNFNGNSEILYNEIKLDINLRDAFVNQQQIWLTKVEYILLSFFMSNINKVLSREAIAEHLIGEQDETLDSLDFIYSHIKNLRKKIIDAKGGDYIKAVYSIGYKFG